MIKQLLISLIMVLAFLGTANAQTLPTPIEEISVSPIFPPPSVTAWPFLKLNCVPQGAWCRYLANTTFGVALGHYLNLPFKMLHGELKGVRAECQATKSFNRCSLYYDFSGGIERPLFLAVCTDYFVDGVMSCGTVPIRPEVESAEAEEASK